MPVLGRCDAEYVVLSDTTVLCAINFAAVLEEHIASGCDITVIAKAGRANGKTRQPLAAKLETTVRLSIWLLTIVRRKTIWSA